MARLKVSDDSLRLMATRVHWVREKAHQANLGKGKMDGASMEAVAEKAAALHALALEFCSEHPVPLETVKQRVLTEWSQGCERIDCEISAALLEKSDSFQIAQQMPCFKSLLEDSLFRTPVSSAQEACMASMQIDSKQNVFFIRLCKQNKNNLQIIVLDHNHYYNNAQKT